jgi:nucleotide-binding universal stress UspA family protein
MDRAILLARQLDAALIVLHVPPEDPPLPAKEEQRLRANLAFDFELPDNAEIIFRYGSVPEVIADVAANRDCSLILTGVARFNSPRDYLLGTAVDYLVRLSPAPVIVVKRRAIDPYRRLLVATDFSPCSIAALRAAAAAFPQAELKLVHSFHAAWEAFLERESTIDVIRDECDRSMKLLLDSLPEDVRSRSTAMNTEGELGNVPSRRSPNPAPIFW